MCSLSRIDGVTKERSRPETGSVPDLLCIFEHELRFYREVAPEVGARVPACHEAVETGEGLRLVLEDLSSWVEGGDPVDVAVVLKDMHARWAGVAERRWPWLNRDGRGDANARSVPRTDMWWRTLHTFSGARSGTRNAVRCSSTPNDSRHSVLASLPTTPSTGRTSAGRRRCLGTDDFEERWSDLAKAYACHAAAVHGQLLRPGPAAVA